LRRGKGGEDVTDQRAVIAGKRDARYEAILAFGKQKPEQRHTSAVV